MILISAAIVLALIFCLIIFFGAPYVPTLRPQAKQGLEMLSLKPGQTLLELGSGDGRVVRLAAQNGLKVIGYELNPILVLISLVVTFKYRKNVKIIWGNYWMSSWPKADGVYAFLIGRYMNKLNKKIEHYPHKPVKLVSLAFEVKGKKPARESGGLFMYEYK